MAKIMWRCFVLAENFVQKCMLLLKQYNTDTNKSARNNIFLPFLIPTRSTSGDKIAKKMLHIDLGTIILRDIPWWYLVLFRNHLTPTVLIKQNTSRFISIRRVRVFYRITGRLWDFFHIIVHEQSRQKPKDKTELTI